MHGLINRSIQCFIGDTYGPQAWSQIADAAEVGADGFEAMLTYEDPVSYAVLDAAALRLSRSRNSILEDLGTYLVSHPNTEPLRRLLRFGGVTFVEFLHSLDDLQGRGRMAVPDLDLPSLELMEHTPDRFTLQCRSRNPGLGHVIVGVLRAMADDYGALAMLDHQGMRDGVDLIAIDLLDQSFAEGRRFELARGSVS